MATNETPTSYTAVVAQSEDAADGAKIYGEGIGLKQNTPLAIRTDLAALIASEDNVGRKRTAKTDANTVHKTADSNGKAFLAHFIDFETPRIGDSGNPLWEEAGFTDGSISLPRTLDDRFILLGKIKIFLHNHPNYEVTDAARPELDVTEVVAEAHYAAVAKARSGINTANAENGKALGLRDAALDVMRTRLTGLRNELTQIPLPEDSAIWYAFGLNRPSDPATPGVPDTLVLTPGAAGSGLLIVDWAASRRATGYRVKIAGADVQPRVLGLFTDDQTVIPNLPLGRLLTITVIAHNDAGDSVESAQATITLA